MKDSEIRLILASIEKNDGTITPDAVVEAAKPKDHPLHSYFEWKNTTAGHLYRVEQARALIARVRMRVDTNVREIRAPLYVRDPDKPTKEQGYVSLPKLVTDAERAGRAMMQEVLYARAALNRARNIADALGLADDVEALLSGIEAVRERIIESA